MAQVVKSLLTTWAAYSMPPALETEAERTPASAQSAMANVVTHLKYERDRLDNEVALMKKKLNQANATIAELASRIRLCCPQVTAERVLIGLDCDRSEESNLASLIEETMTATNEVRETEVSESDGSMCWGCKKFANFESRLDAQIRKSEKTLERMLSKMKNEREVFTPAVQQIKKQIDREISVGGEADLMDSLVRKLNMLSEMETLKQSALRYDLFCLEQVFNSVISALCEAEFSVMALLHIQKVPAELIEKFEVLVTRRIDLSFEQPSVHGITHLLGLIPQYESLFRRIVKEDYVDSMSVCDVIGIAHRVGQLASDSQRTLSDLAQNEFLEHRIHSIQSSLLTAKASLVATEEGTIEYVSRLFQIIREQEAIKVEILKRARDEVQDEEEKHAKTATELQSLVMEYLSIVSQLASFSRKSPSRFIDMVPYLPENEQEIVQFSEEARRRCAEALSEMNSESMTQIDFLLEVLSECEKSLSVVAESENSQALCRNLKRHLIEGRSIGETETKRVVPWTQVKEVLVTTIQMLLAKCKQQTNARK